MHAVIVANHDIGRLQIAMHQLQIMYLLQAIDNFFGQKQKPGVVDQFDSNLVQRRTIDIVTRQHQVAADFPHSRSSTDVRAFDLANQLDCLH